MITAAPGDTGSEQDAGPLLPGYGRSSLADLGESLLAAAGVPAANPLGLDPAARSCLLLVDGLGWELLARHRQEAPFLASLAGGPLTAGFPATTATSLASLGTALPPGRHGMLGYQVRVPGTGRLLNALRWDKTVDPVTWQPAPTVFERAAAAGVACCRVAAGDLEKSGLSVAAMRGADYRAADTPGALAAVAAAAVSEAPRVLATVYTGALDATGHAHGASSLAWALQLAHVDRLAQQLAEQLPAGTAMYVTADHGMVDVPPGERIDADAVPALREGVALLGGEGRARHVYARPGAAGDVLAAWRETLGDRAWVLSRDEAVTAGWFGPSDPAVTGRAGDVVAALRGRSAVVASKSEPRESALAGMHGSLTPDEQRIPLLRYVA